MKRDRKELATLKRENQRLRKLLSHLESQAQERAETAQDEDEQLFDQRPSKRKKRPDGKQRREPQTEHKPGERKCPHCQSGTEIVELGRFEYRFCLQRCGYREKYR